MTTPQGNVGTQRPEFSMPFKEFMEMPDRFGFVGLKVLRPIVVNRQSGSYYMDEVEQELKEADPTVGSGGNYNRVEDSFTEVDYKTKEIGLEARLRDRMVQAYPDYPSAEGAAVGRLYRKIHRYLERQITTWLQDTSIITQTAAVDDEWNDLDSSNPQLDITNAALAIHASTGLIADTVVMSYKRFMKLIINDKIRDVFKSSGFQDPRGRKMWESIPDMAAILGVPRLLVAGAVRNSAAEGQAASLASFWSDDKIGVYVTAGEGQNIEAPCIGRIPTWPGDGAAIGTGEEPSLVLESYREEQTRSNVYRTRAELDLAASRNLVMPKAGYILTGADAAVD